MSARADRQAGDSGVLRVALDPTGFPKKLLLACISIELLLYFFDYLFNYRAVIDIGPFRRLWTTTIESSFPSFFSIGQTLLVAVTLWIIVWLARARGDRRLVVAGWIVLACFFSYMAIDDGAKFHERIGTTLGRIASESGVESSFPSYNWQRFLLPFYGSLGLFTMIFSWFRMRDTLSRVLVVVAIGMLVTAVGIDFIEGLDQHHPWNLYDNIAQRYELDAWGQSQFGKSGYVSVQHFFKSAEELFFEAGANSVLWFLFLRYLLRMTGAVEIRFGGR